MSKQTKTDSVRHKTSKKYKLGSVAEILVNNINRNKSSLFMIDDEYLSNRAKLRVSLYDQDSIRLEEMDHEILESKNSYRLVKHNKPFADTCYLKVRLNYDSELKQNVNSVKTKVFDRENKLIAPLTIEQLNDLLNKYKKWKVLIKAACVFTHNGKKGVNYMVDEIKLL